MRLLLALAALVLPAAAEAETARPAIDPAQAAAALQNPLVQEGIAGALSQLAGIVLDTRVGGLATLTGPDGDIRPGDTLRDVERRRDPAFEARLQDSARGAVAAAGAVAGETAEMQRTAARLKAALAPLLAYAHAARAPAADEGDPR